MAVPRATPQQTALAGLPVVPCPPGHLLQMRPEDWDLPGPGDDLTVPGPLDHKRSWEKYLSRCY